MKTLYKVDGLEGKRVKFIRNGRKSKVVQQRSQSRLVIVWNDKPEVFDEGYLDEEFVFDHVKEARL